MPRNPKYQKVQGIILSRKPLREADLLFTVYTKGSGKIKILGRSTRKAGSKLSAKLQQLYQVDLDLAGSGLWPTIISATVTNKYAKLRQSLPALAAAFYGTELTMRITPESDENAKVYELLERFLSELDKNHKKIKLEEKEKIWPPTLEKFRLDLLRLLGHGLSTRFCAHCGIKMEPGKDASFSCFAGGIVHQDCGRSFPDIRKIDAVTAGQLSLLDQQAIEDVIEMTVSDEAHRVTSEFINFLLERNLKSEKFLDQVMENEN